MIAQTLSRFFGRATAAPAAAPTPMPFVYWYPSTGLLAATPHVNLTEAGDLQVQHLADVLKSYKVRGQLTRVQSGPVLITYEFQPDPGVKGSSVIALAPDIARAMGALSVRIAPIPGQTVLGIEIARIDRMTVGLAQVLDELNLTKCPATLPIALGVSTDGKMTVADLSTMPHLLMAGTTGSGKSVTLHTIILSLLYCRTPDEVRFVMIDPKMLELAVYNDIPHLDGPVITDPRHAVVRLLGVLDEMESRYRLMAAVKVRNLAGYNHQARAANRLPSIVVVVDEFADLMAVAGKELETAVQRIAQMGRAAGIHLIMATQRPSVDVITGTIKANFPTRISFAMASKVDSRTILNEGGAEQLLGQGDMLFTQGGRPAVRIHGALVTESEVEAVCHYLNRSR